MSDLTRREFLGGCVATAGALMAPAAAAATPPVVIVGAGLAGLAAAHALGQAQIPFVVLEQSGHAGGRVRTVRDHFADGAWVDVGAQAGGSGYVNWIALCEAYGVAMSPGSPRPSAPPDTLLIVDGQRYSKAMLAAGELQWPFELKADEYAAAPARLLGQYLMPVAREIGAPANVLDGNWSCYDGMTLGDFLRERGASPGALALIERPLNYNGLDSVSALSALRDATRLLARQELVSIAGGNDTLTSAIAQKHSAQVAYGVEVEALVQRDDGVDVQVRQHGASRRLQASRVIVTLPMPALARVDVALPAARREIVNHLPYTQIAKTHVQTRTRFWDQPRDVAAVYSNGPFERVFDMSDSMQSERGLLLNWINGNGLRAFDGLDDAAHAERVVDWLASAWPEHADAFETTLVTHWGRSYAGGAYAHYAPGQLQRWAPVIGQPVDRLHFAGEHTQLVEPGMEGAVTSGLRAAREVIEKARA